ncbi:hypothetical protein ACHAWF_001178 [Thalassiosira exigua]
MAAANIRTWGRHQDLESPDRRWRRRRRHSSLTPGTLFALVLAVSLASTSLVLLHAGWAPAPSSWAWGPGAKVAEGPHKIATFLRIPKTGSTALSSFLWNLPSVERLADLLVFEDRRLAGQAMSHCMYVFYREDEDDDDATAANANATKNETGSDDGYYYHGREDPCPHLEYEDKADWFDTAQKAYSHFTPLEYGLHDPDGRITSHWFTMVRDPYDRLVSLFHYSKRDTLGHDYNDDQLEYIKTDNLEAWIQSLAEEDNKYEVEQYYWLSSEGLQNATDLISGYDPAIFVLINECFEASLRLLLEEFRLSDPGEGDLVAPFVQAKKRHREGKYNRTKTLLGGNDTLRARATEWFADDYAFYRRAVKQFQRAMRRSVERSGGNHAHFDTCEYYSPARIKRGGELVKAKAPTPTLLAAG